MPPSADPIRREGRIWLDPGRVVRAIAPADGPTQRLPRPPLAEARLRRPTGGRYQPRGSVHLGALSASDDTPSRQRDLGGPRSSDPATDFAAPPVIRPARHWRSTGLGRTHQMPPGGAS